jgi:HPt (histidine-containing phosphotransfer) domain-containing protein
MGEVLSPVALCTLCDELGADAACSFAHHYLSLLDARVQHLTEALAGDDAEAAWVVALSLHSSSAMVGALALAEVSRALATQLRAGALAAARLAMCEVVALATATARALLAFLARPAVVSASA